MDKIGFSAYEIDNLAIEPLLFQTGYITIKDYDLEFASYTLSYPNLEVKNAFIRFWADTFVPVRKELAASHLMALVKAHCVGTILIRLWNTCRYSLPMCPTISRCRMKNIIRPSFIWY